MRGSRMKELRDALCDSFDAQALKELVRFRLDEELTEIVEARAALGKVVFDLIDTASKQGWLGDLVLAACEERPRKPALLAFRNDPEVLAAKLGRVEDKVNEQQQLINQLVATSMSDSAFHHLAGITLLREYKYWQNHNVGELFRRELYYLKDRGFIGPQTLEFFAEMDGSNLVGMAMPTEIGRIYVTLRRADVPQDWLSANPSKRQNLKVDVARGLGLEVPELD